MPLSEQNKKRLNDLVDQISTVHKRIKDLILSEEDSHILRLTPEQSKEYLKLINQEEQSMAEFYSIVKSIMGN